ncbi:MAG: hypothetical protein HY578_04200 [Nitrospinae bacterium]|nr:hypothetical protein [Nitrospinota bacterium]
MIPLKKLIIHIHHISTHFTNSLFPVSGALITLYLFTNNSSFETASYYSMVFGLMAIPSAYGSGIYDWRTRFQGRKTFIFTNKVIFGIIFLIVASLCVIWRTVDAGIMYSMGWNKWLYVALVYSLTALATWLGYLGGKFI